MPSFEEEFRESKGQPIDYCGNTIIRMDRIKVEKVFSGYVELISTNSDWLQGVILDVNGELEINSIKGQKFILWQNYMKNGGADIILDTRTGGPPCFPKKKRS